MWTQCFNDSRSVVANDKKWSKYMEGRRSNLVKRDWDFAEIIFQDKPQSHWIPVSLSQRRQLFIMSSFFGEKPWFEDFFLRMSSSYMLVIWLIDPLEIFYKPSPPWAVISGLAGDMTPHTNLRPSIIYRFNSKKPVLQKLIPCKYMLEKF